ncbi:hypothetical protein [Methylocapsa sp. S129]|uniref:hypothetical protein n=1 Tax=Methylocapsa sp. S129 TaxID=1641869 RepID=UPI00131B65ED|nr:hypothetical protein [Methylocapsa sp. S129]
MLMCRERDRAKTALTAALVVLAFAFLGVGARADDSAPAAPPPDEGIVRNVAKKIETISASKIPVTRTIAKKIGMATDPGEPQDFVVKSRPAGEEDYIPVGRKEFEHTIKVKTPAELKAIEADFDAVKVRHDALRSNFAPARKAVADAEAAKAAKAEKKKKPPVAPPAAASPQ